MTLKILLGLVIAIAFLQVSGVAPALSPATPQAQTCDNAVYDWDSWNPPELADRFCCPLWKNVTAMVHIPGALYYSTLCRYVDPEGSNATPQPHCFVNIGSIISAACTSINSSRENRQVFATSYTFIRLITVDQEYFSMLSNSPKECPDMTIHQHSKYCPYHTRPVSTFNSPFGPSSLSCFRRFIVVPTSRA
jgi:hypothetical protein